MQEDYTGHGIVIDLMDIMEDELKKRGYKYLERNSKIGNGFAKCITNAYDGRIVCHKPVNDPQHGTQEFFRIKL